jgi:hypothetical protein
MSYDPNPIIDSIVSHALALGRFDRVNGAEPRNAPGPGLTAAVWNQHVGPAQGQSGLASTSALLVFNVRLYSSADASPADAIDPNMMTAEAELIDAYTGDFTFGGLIEYVDLLGSTSPGGLHSDAGYLQMDAKTFRVRTITVPVIVADVWSQSS